MKNKLIDYGEYYQIDLNQGSFINQLRIDFDFSLVVYEDKDKYIDISISGQFEYTEQGRKFIIIPQNTEDLKDVLCLFKKRVESIKVFKSGNIFVSFDGGSQLFVEHSIQGEAWELSSSKGLKIVSVSNETESLMIWQED